MNNKNKNNLSQEIKIDFINEISVNDLIYAIDNSDIFSLFEINEEEYRDSGEKNILINIRKINPDGVKINAI